MNNTKKILITGKDSYIGAAVQAWLLAKKQHYIVDELCLKDNSWKDADFSAYDAVFHVAGIAHSDTGNADDEEVQRYYKVNTDLTVAVAKKAKRSGVGQFIFMSSMIVFGASAPIGTLKRINAETTPKPLNFYGDSKLQAEIGLATVAAKDFKIAIIRPPMVYGKNVRGNYPRLAKIASSLSVFPAIANERSMIHIDNLCEFIYLIIKDKAHGTFHPQNSEYVSTANMVKSIGKAHNKQIRLIKTTGFVLKQFAKVVGSINKVFGNFSYDMSMSEYSENYRVRSFEESIELTEK